MAKGTKKDKAKKSTKKAEKLAAILISKGHDQMAEDFMAFIAVLYG
jgi:hypothetical protein